MANAVDEPEASSPPLLPGSRFAEHLQAGRQPFVLLSGMLGDVSLWDGIAALLTDVVQPCPTRIDLDDSVTEMAATVLATAPSQFVLGGHSLGAIVALEMMRQAPQRVTRLALMNASARGPTDVQQEAWAEWRRRTVHGEFHSIVTELAQVSLAEPRRGDQVLIEAYARMARTVGPDGFLRQLSAQATRPDSRHTLAAMDVPVLVLSGELDEVCPLALQREILEGCPSAEFHSIEGSGHMLPLECPHALADRLRDWLRGW